MGILPLKQGRPAEPLVVSVAGATLGLRVLGLVSRDLKPFLDVARKVGLTGRALALAADAATAEAVQESAIADGVTVDTAVLEVPLPVPDGSFDLAFVDERPPRTGGTALVTVLPSVVRALRPGGRVLVVVAAPAGLLGRLMGSRPAPDVSPVLDACRAAGFSAGRLVTVRDGLAFVEAIRPGGGSPAPTGH